MSVPPSMRRLVTRVALEKSSRNRSGMQSGGNAGGGGEMGGDGAEGGGIAGGGGDSGGGHASLPTSESPVNQMSSQQAPSSASFSL